MVLPALTVADGSSKGKPAAAGESGAPTAGDAFDRDALALAEESAGIGVWSIDLTENRVRGTAQFFRILGLEPTSDSVPVDVIRALRVPGDRERVLAGFREALGTGGDTYEIEYRIIRPDGNLRWIFGRGRVIRDGEGRPVRYSGVDLDITERKATEDALDAARQELERMNQVLEQRVRDRTADLETEAARRLEAESRLNQAQKMEAVGQLTGGIAHDFNNILQVIMGSLEIVMIALQRGAAGGPGNDARALAERVTTTAQRATQSAKQLIQRLLAFSRQQPLAPKTLDCNRLVGEMTEIIDRLLGATIRVETMLAPEGTSIFADRNQLESVLLNLVVNARDAMPKGGRLRIETANVDCRHDCPDELTPGHYVLLSVVDTGCGIAKEHLHRVFEPFFTTKDTGQGSGLGLSMVYGFVKQSGGHAHIDSDAGQGTTVRIYLPRSHPDDGALPDADARSNVPATGRPSARPG
ncbi:MAG: ATP-binding protein, partial [Casimicrobiaceae bacterium]